ncbi:hypothetical protein FH972_018510 [Carpinus fangiana]|uniref:Uncharacterized protein n=1 Tax=Carpinus fangiana TaxID=176857 RepID=A0A5N6RR62_9ROSI|nr:hypothetical protein FH972_018510 [Carpinus fangiana]
MAATFKLIYTSAFLLALIFSHGIISTEERQLRTQTNMKCSLSVCENNAREMGRNLHRGILDDEVRSPAGVSNVETNGTTDDFRPTEPGHSPGAGHAKGPRTADPNQ